MVRGPNGRRHRYVPRVRRRRRGLQRGGVLPMLAVASRLGRSRRNGGLADVKGTTPQKRKAVTFALDWDDRYTKLRLGI